MATRLIATVRSAAAGLLVLTLAGATAADRPAKYVLRCRLSDVGHGSIESPKISVASGESWNYFAGGDASTADARHIEFGSRIAGCVTRDRHDGAVVTLELTLDCTHVVSHQDDGSEVTVGGQTTRTVRTVHVGRPTHIAVGDAAGTVLDVTVDPG